jgi:hypothetical protein
MNKRNWSWRPFFPKSKHFRPLASAFDLLLCPTQGLFGSDLNFFCQKISGFTEVVQNAWTTVPASADLIRTLDAKPATMAKPLRRWDQRK